MITEDSTRRWSGEIFWNKDWNRDINFEQAFQSSCIWYFREVIDELGAQTLKKELNNCNTETAISQAEVMNRIFNKKVNYQSDILDQLKKVMLAAGQDASEDPVYGKTGLGGRKARKIAIRIASE